MNPQDQRFVPVEALLEFVNRTISHGCPTRVAIKRAARKYGVDAGLVRAFVRFGRS